MRRTLIYSLALTCLAFSGDSSEAGLFRHRARVAYRQSAPGCTAGACATAPAAYPTPSVVDGSGEAHGFLAWLNATRARHGLGAVSYDAGLAGWAHRNNAAQASRGLGHHVMGPARRQNSAMGGYGSLASMWMASPAHRAALLDPTISRVGLAGSGGWWTFNAA